MNAEHESTGDNNVLVPACFSLSHKWTYTHSHTHIYTCLQTIDCDCACSSGACADCSRHVRAESFYYNMPSVREHYHTTTISCVYVDNRDRNNYLAYLVQQQNSAISSGSQYENTDKAAAHFYTDKHTSNTLWLIIRYHIRFALSFEIETLAK